MAAEKDQKPKIERLAQRNFNPSDLFQEIQKADFDPSIFEKVDERDIPKAPNFLTWSVDPKFLNTTVLPKQLEIATKLLAEYCPDCSNPGYIDTLYDQSIGQIKDNIQFLENGRCPKCKQNRFELIKSGKLGAHSEMIGALGQRSGKTKFVGLLSTYVLHRFLKLPDPLRYFGLPSGELLMGTFSALTAEQCRDTLWESFKGFLDASPWFQAYHDFLKAEGRKVGAELHKSLATFVAYGHKHVLFHYTGSEGKKMRGKTRIFAAIDELGWMNSDEGNQNAATFMNADQVYTALANSLATMRMKYNQRFSEDNFDVPPVIMANISSPSSVRDKIMRLVKAAKDNPKMLAFELPTWECNPDYTYDTLRSEFAQMSESDFMRDFGAQPPLASDPFLSDARLIDKMATGSKISNFDILPISGIDAMGDSFKSAELKIVAPDKNTPRLLAFDLGFKKNALAMCMFSITPESKPKLDFCLALMPLKGCPVNIVHFFENVTVPLVQNFNIKFAFFDRWQSLDQVQRLRDMAVDAKVHSLTYKEMDSVRGAIMSQALVIPQLDRPMEEFVKDYIESDSILSNSSANLGLQLLTVRDLGHKMTKPLQGDDDLFRAFCLGAVKIQEPNIKKVFLQGPKSLPTGHVVESYACVRTRGGNYSSTNPQLRNSNNFKDLTSHGVVRLRTNKK